MDGAQEVFQDTIETVQLLENRINENTFKYIAISAGVFFLFLLLRKIFTKYILGFLLKLSGKSKTEIGTKIVEAFQQPVRDFFIVLGIYFAILFLGRAFRFNLIREPFLNHIYKSANIILASWGFYNLTTEHVLCFMKSYQISLILN
jgi:MscS family membrane protein